MPICVVNPEKDLLVTNCNAVLSTGVTAASITIVYSPLLPVEVALCITYVVPVPPNWNCSDWLGGLFVNPSAIKVVEEDTAPLVNGVPCGW